MADPLVGQQLNRMLTGSWITQGIYVAAELGIADALSQAPRTAAELAERTGADAGALYRLLRALASVGIVAEDERGRFALTPLGDLLRSEDGGAPRALAIMMGAEFYETWGKLLYSVRTGKPGFQEAFGSPFFGYMTRKPARHALYDAAMTGVHGAETEPVLDAYDFSQCETVVDVGGGNGLMLAAILKRYPGAAGILFDLPAVADRARGLLAEQGLEDRCQAVGGDFFAAVPPGADAYLMRHVIHDWEDDEAVAILRNCRAAMGPKARLLVVETVIPAGNEPCFGKWLDLMMLLVGGRERTEAEYRALFARAGLSLNQVIATAHEVSIIEAVPAVASREALPAGAGSESRVGSSS